MHAGDVRAEIAKKVAKDKASRWWKPFLWPGVNSVHLSKRFEAVDRLAIAQIPGNGDDFRPGPSWGGCNCTHLNAMRELFDYGARTSPTRHGTRRLDDADGR